MHKNCSQIPGELYPLDHSRDGRHDDHSHSEALAHRHAAHSPCLAHVREPPALVAHTHAAVADLQAHVGRHALSALAAEVVHFFAFQTGDFYIRS